MSRSSDLTEQNDVQGELIATELRIAALTSLNLHGNDIGTEGRRALVKSGMIKGAAGTFSQRRARR